MLILFSINLVKLKMV
uniref:Uncharacterized protein n=1 Tax=Arundo donax TaxID=35708 RepID=A0A0A8ZX31_ARUDO